MTGRGRLLCWLAASSFVATILAANAHLAYVAFASRPDCVDHLRTGDGAPSAQAAATSSC